MYFKVVQKFELASQDLVAHYLVVISRFKYTINYNVIQLIFKQLNIWD